MRVYNNSLKYKFNRSRSARIWLSALVYTYLQTFYCYTSVLRNRFQKFPLQASTPIRFRRVFKSFHLGERFLCVFARYVQTKVGSVTKYLGIQTNPNTCEQDLKIPFYLLLSQWYCVTKIKIRHGTWLKVGEIL